MFSSRNHGPNVCRLEDGGNPDHLHKSHFSGIYYLRTEGEGGTLTPKETYMDDLPLGVEDDYCVSFGTQKMVTLLSRTNFNRVETLVSGC